MFGAKVVRYKNVEFNLLVGYTKMRHVAGFLDSRFVESFVHISASRSS